MLDNHSDTSRAEVDMPVTGRPMTVPGPPAWVLEEDAADAHPDDYKNPEVVNRWLDWESE